MHAVVNMSQISARREATSHAAATALDRRTPAGPHRLAHHPSAADVLRRMAELVLVRARRGGVLRLPFADGRHAPIARSDQAPSSPPSCAIRRRTTGRSIRSTAQRTRPRRHRRESRTTWASRCATNLSTSPVRRGARVEGHGALPLQHISNVAQDYRDGIFAGTNNLVEVISGLQPCPWNSSSQPTARLHDRRPSAGVKKVRA